MLHSVTGGVTSLFLICFPNSLHFELAIWRCLEAEEVAQSVRLVQPDWLVAVDRPLIHHYLKILETIKLLTN